MCPKKASIFPYMPCSVSQLPAAPDIMKTGFLQWFVCPVIDKRQKGHVKCYCWNKLLFSQR